MPLEEWQTTLEEHFSSLVSKRAAANLPVFALEHNLKKGDLVEIAPLLHSRLQSNFDLEKHWLVWVVYATEHGYGYNGGEYWPSFQKATPGWEGNDRRKQLKRWFRRFQTEYNGVKPSGKWARQFPIITLPITHAILPKYLQIRFAQTLYETRYKLASLSNLEPNVVGQTLAVSASDMSSRFQEFLQQEELVGRIVLSLLNKSAHEQDLIYVKTLERVIVDLEEVQTSREWLNDTRKFFKDGYWGTGNANFLPRVGKGNISPSIKPKIKPSLQIRSIGQHTWSIILEIPNFQSVARINSALSSFFRGTRCKVVSDASGWRAPGWLLSGTQKTILKFWPEVNRSLIEFEQKNPVVELLLNECKLTSGSTWICRIGADGIAREVIGRIVRPGENYIVLTKEEIASDSPHLKSCAVNCENINAYQLSLPEALSKADIDALQKLDLQVARTIRVWPTGLCAREWDGEGQSEWLTTETPCFGIVDDHPVESYSLRLNSELESLVRPTAPGAPIFIQIPSLPAGEHILHIRPKRSSSEDSALSNWDKERYVRLNVRTPEVWVPGTTLHSGLSVSTDPYNPSLDDFWEGRVALNILGPESRNINFNFVLETADKVEILSAPIGPIPLPVTSDIWAKTFYQFLKSKKENSWKYLQAASGKLLIRGEELGEHTLHLERDVKPLHWICRTEKNVTDIRLVDDTDTEDSTVVNFMSFQRPLLSKIYDASICLNGFALDNSGGLFTAERGKHRDAIVVGSPQIDGGLSGFQIDPDFQDLGNSATEIFILMQKMAIWEKARSAGFSQIRQEHIIKKMHINFYERLCGISWVRQEELFLKNPHDSHVIEGLKRLVHEKPAYAAAINVRSKSNNHSIEADMDWFIKASTERYNVSSDPKLCKFSLQIADQPIRTNKLYDQETIIALIEGIKNSPTLMRGARLLTLLYSSAEA